MEFKGSNRNQVKAVAAPVQKGLFHGLEKGKWHNWETEDFVFILRVYLLKILKHCLYYIKTF